MADDRTPVYSLSRLLSFRFLNSFGGSVIGSIGVRVGRGDLAEPERTLFLGALEDVVLLSRRRWERGSEYAVVEGDSELPDDPSLRTHRRHCKGSLSEVEGVLSIGPPLTFHVVD